MGKYVIQAKSRSIWVHVRTLWRTSHSNQTQWLNNPRDGASGHRVIATPILALEASDVKNWLDSRRTFQMLVMALFKMGTTVSSKSSPW